MMPRPKSVARPISDPSLCTPETVPYFSKHRYKTSVTTLTNLELGWAARRKATNGSGQKRSSKRKRKNTQNNQFCYKF